MEKEQCEKMLDQEAERVARSILQLVNSVKFSDSQFGTDPKVVHTCNKIAYSLKQVITDEITKQFLNEMPDTKENSIPQ